MPGSNGVTLATPQEMQRVLAESRQTPFGVKVPKWAEPVTRTGYVVVPAAYGTQVQITSHQAKANWYAVMFGIVLQFQGGGPAPNPGDVLFNVDIDRPAGDNTAGYIEKDYGSIPFLLGNFTAGPLWPCEFRYSNGETLRIKATPVANMGLDVGNWFVAGLIGFEWPQQGYEGF